MTRTIESPTLLLAGQITTDLAAAFFNDFMQADAAKHRGGITVRILSPGGEASAGFAIYDLLRMARNKVVTEAWGDCSSVAALIFQAGAVRRIAPNAKIYLHRPGTVFNGQMPVRDMEAHLDALERMESLYIAAFAFRSKVRTDLVRDWCSNDRTFFANEAVDNKLADEVIQ